MIRRSIQFVFLEALLQTWISKSFSTWSHSIISNIDAYEVVGVTDMSQYTNAILFFEAEKYVNRCFNIYMFTIKCFYVPWKIPFTSKPFLYCFPWDLQKECSCE